jgi:hypothetical protein
MVQRRPSVPPILPGFSHVRMLGSGGFADVFLYEQNMPRRQVAVKVMLADVVTDHVRQMFQVEANVMAQLSSHPGILTVYQASVSADGRPYLVMELCSPRLGTRFRSESIPVLEVLRIGVQVASAVETAHRQGVLHRDIKPSNILLTAFGHPVLSDFGIASTLSAAHDDDTVGMSIPWSAPEVLLDETPGTVQSEVWSLGATLYSLLAGRSPFELVGGENTPQELVGRITRARVPAIDRVDLPASLLTVLRRSLSRDPGKRQQSVLELIRDLQRVEAELGVVATQADVTVQEWALGFDSYPATPRNPENPSDPGSFDDVDARTIVRALASPAPTAIAYGRRRRTAAARVAAAAHSVDSAPARAPRFSGRAGSRGAITAVAFAATALAVVALGVAATFVAVQGDDDDLPQVSNVEARVDGGTVVFSWIDPGLAPGDTYQVRVADGAETFQRTTQFAVAAPLDARVCVSVRVVREGRLGVASDEKCATGTQA